MPPGPPVASTSSMRIFALPLTRAAPNRPALVYYLASLPPRKKSPADESRSAVLARKGMKKVTDTWNKWGNMESGWQKRVWDFGQRAQSKIAFEELSLKSIDPALGPKVTSAGEGAKILDELGHGDSSKYITLLYPSKFASIVQEEPLAHFDSHISHQGPKARRLFWTYTTTIPFTAPFMLIPVIPNIPFFFVAWRAWGNYKAYKASDYLKELLSAKAIVAQVSPALDVAYHHNAAKPKSLKSSSSPSPSSPSPSPSTSPEKESKASSSDSTPPATEDDIVLAESKVHGLILALGLPSEVISEVVNAIRQARTRLGLPKRTAVESDTPTVTSKASDKDQYYQ